MSAPITHFAADEVLPSGMAPAMDDYGAVEIVGASRSAPVVPAVVPDAQNDPVHRPAHYTEHPSGIECIQITEHMGFNLGNAVKYIWRCDLKKDAIEDLKKARWYLDREIAKREAS